MFTGIMQVGMYLGTFHPIIEKPDHVERWSMVHIKIEENQNFLPQIQVSASINLATAPRPILLYFPDILHAKIASFFNLVLHKMSLRLKLDFIANKF